MEKKYSTFFRIYTFLKLSSGNALVSEVEESRLLVETADRARRAAEMELNECRDKVR